MRHTHDVKVMEEGYDIIKKIGRGYKNGSDQNKEKPCRNSAEKAFSILDEENLELSFNLFSPQLPYLNGMSI